MLQSGYRDELMVLCAVSPGTVATLQLISGPQAADNDSVPFGCVVSVVKGRSSMSVGSNEVVGPTSSRNRPRNIWHQSVAHGRRQTSLSKFPEITLIIDA